MAIDNTVSSLEFLTATTDLISDNLYGPGYYAIDWYTNTISGNRYGPNNYAEGWYE